MPWIIVHANGEELQRVELSRPVTVGRSPECGVAVRDLLLSRTHCRLEPIGAGASWRVVDLGSKNGTRVGWQKVQAQVLKDGDGLRMGRTRLTYRTGPFEHASTKPRPDRLIRPADPHEALTGTVTDFVLMDDGEARNDEDGVGWHPAGMAYPQPRPVDPTEGFEPSPDLLVELAQTVASSRGEDGSRGGGRRAAAQEAEVEGLEFFPAPIDGGGTATVVAPQKKRRALPKVSPIYREITAMRRQDADLSLQAEERYLPAVVATPVRKTSRVRRVIVGAAIGIGVLAATGVVGMSAWLLTMGR
ncbi:MAG: FHA domain-containing protein [Phycisphaerae bacterium]